MCMCVFVSVYTYNLLTYTHKNTYAKVLKDMNVARVGYQNKKIYFKKLTPTSAFSHKLIFFLSVLVQRQKRCLHGNTIIQTGKQPINYLAHKIPV